MRSSSFMFSEFAASHVTTHRCDNVTLYVTVGTMASVLCLVLPEYHFRSADCKTVQLILFHWRHVNIT